MAYPYRGSVQKDWMLCCRHGLRLHICLFPRVFPYSRDTTGKSASQVVAESKQSPVFDERAPKKKIPPWHWFYLCLHPALSAAEPQARTKKKNLCLFGPPPEAEHLLGPR